ncbi:phosphoesterase PA-phosphatase, partial [Streptomyces sp. NPDC059233]
MKPSRSALLTFGSALVLSATVALPSAQAAVPAPADSGGAVVREWYDTTAQTVAAAGAPTQVTNSRTWAISWLAAARATREAPGGRGRAAFQDAAVASAVHDALVALAPTRKAELDAALAGSLAKIPDGPAERRGVAAGARQASLALADRQGDG